MKTLIVLASLVVSSVFSLSQAEVLYSVTDLGTLGGTESRAYGINESGQVVGESLTAAGNGHAFLYDGTSMTDLGGNSKAYGINDNGQVVGSSFTGAVPHSAPHAFLYDGTTMNDLGTLGGYISIAVDINNSGKVVGWSETTTDIFFPGHHAFLYDGTSMTDLGTLGEDGSFASGINASGQVVGNSSTEAYVPHAFLYDGTTMTDLGTLGGERSWAGDINNNGQVVGFSYITGGSWENPHAFLSDGTTMTDLGTLGGTESRAHAINDSGQVVGFSDIVGDSDHAFLYDDIGGMLDLNNLIPSDSGWVLKDAHDINSSGQIVGSGVIGGETHAFLLTPCNYVLTGDLDYNCKVDFADFALMAGNWMIDCNADSSYPGCVSK